MFPTAEKIGALLNYPFGRTAPQAAATLPSDESPSKEETRLNPFEIKKVEYADLPQAAAIHSVSWQASHQAICSEAFLSIHTPEHQKKYLEQAMENGAEFYMLSVKGKPVGIVSVHKSLIENLYILPEEQNRGYGTRLLRYAIEKCNSAPTLWILEKNDGAHRLYERIGFHMTGRTHALSDTIAECEMRLC